MMLNIIPGHQEFMGHILLPTSGL